MMSGFQLNKLDAFLLEKTLRKIEQKSYFRLLQTSRAVYDFIYRNNVTVYQPSIHLHKYRNRWGVSLYHHQIPFVIQVESLYGVRVGSFDSFETANCFEEMCDTLRNNRITSSRIFIYGKKASENWTPGQCTTVFNILKPDEVLIDSETSPRYESLLQFKEMKSITVYLDEADVITTATRLLPMFSKVAISLNAVSSPFIIVHDVLKALNTGPFQKLSEFCYFAYCKQWPPPVEGDFDKLPFTFRVRIVNGAKRTIFATVAMPGHSASCEVQVNWYKHGCTTQINYKRVDDPKSLLTVAVRK